MEQGVFQSCRYSQMNSDIIDHHQHHWAAVVSRGWAKASACRLQVNPLVRSSARSCPSRICSGRLYTACGWFPLWYGLKIVMYVHEFHRSSLKQLVSWDHFIFLTLLIMSMTFVLFLTQMLVFLSLYVMVSYIRLSILV